MKIASATLRHKSAMSRIVRVNNPAAVINSRQTHGIQARSSHPFHNIVSSIVSEIPSMQEQTAEREGDKAISRGWIVDIQMLHEFSCVRMPNGRCLCQHNF